MKFTKFRVFNYRNVHDSGLIDISEITAFVGQNEAGKSNLFEALYRVNPFDEQAKYRFEEDWPVDKWGDKNPKAKVCEAFFELDSSDISALFDACTAAMNAVDDDEEGKPPKLPAPPKELTICGHRRYGHTSHFYVVGDLSKVLKSEVRNSITPISI